MSEPPAPGAPTDSWRELVAGAPQYLLLLDEELRFHYVNKPRPGYTDPTDRSVFEFLPEAYQDSFRKASRTALDTGYPQYLEVQAADPEGNASWYSSWVVPLPDSQPERLAVIADNVTDRFRTLVEYAPEAVVILDADAGTFVEVNDNACRLFGLSRADLLARGPLPLSPERQPDGSLSSLAGLSRVQDAVDGKHAVFEWTHLDGAGNPLPCEVRLVPLPGKGRRLLRGSILDVSERKRAEAERDRLTAELAQAQKLQAVGQLTGGIAHDFNNLLTVIMSSVEMIEARPECSDGIRKHARQALAAADRAAALTQRLLAFARRQPLRPQIVDLNRLVVDADGLLRRTLDETINIEMSLGDGLWPCETDPTQLENVILNLAINARDAMPNGGHLSIETTNVGIDAGEAQQLGDVAPGAYVMLTVGDNGTGMDKAVLSQVFEPFFTTKDPGQGSGLGLSMVYGFVKQSNGHVSIRSTPGTGTTVRIYLPRSEATPARAADIFPRDTGLAEVGHGQKVLVVEDEPAVRDLVVEGLQSLGYQTLDAPDARAALALLHSAADIQLLLTDVVLPGGLNGPELVRRIRLLRPGLPVLFMSGYAEHAMTQEGRLEGDVLLLEKPFTRQQLARAVRETMESGTNHAG